MPKPMPRATLLLVALSFLAVHAAAESTAAAPSKVVVLSLPSDPEVQLAWLMPVEGPADTYRVYGYTSSGRVLLEETALLTARVAAGYVQYAVAAVHGDVESDAQPAKPCVTFETGNLPPLAVRPEGCHG